MIKVDSTNINTILTFDSDEELYTSWFLNQLIVDGFVKSYTPQPKPIILNKGLSHTVITKKGAISISNGSPRLKVIIPVKTYTCDFKVIWNKCAEGVFVYNIDNITYLKHNWLLRCQTINGELVSHFEVKPNFDFKNMTRSVKYSIAMAWDYSNILVELFKPLVVFKNLYYPERYSKTNMGGSFRKSKGVFIKDKTQLSDYLKRMEYGSKTKE
jgi:hypothetical protein